MLTTDLHSPGRQNDEAGLDTQQPTLSQLLALTPTGQGAFESPFSNTNNNGNIYGGQLIAQAVAASSKGLPEAFTAHSLQLGFLAPGRTGATLKFEVHTLLHGRNFISRLVQCTQDQRMVFSAQVSFHRGEAGPEHSLASLIHIPAPDSLRPLRQLAAEHLPPHQLSSIGNSRNIEMRPVQGSAFLFERFETAKTQFWIRTRQPLPACAHQHQAALGYLSDYWLPITALTPHLDSRVNTGLYIASLNHTLWFHAPFKADEWLLFDVQSPRALNGRALIEGHVYDQAGTLVATAIQETLFRGWDKRLIVSTQSTTPSHQGEPT